MQCPVCHSPPIWSPSGQTLAFRVSNPGGGAAFTAMAEPSPNRVKLFPEMGRPLLCWSDSDHWVEATGPGGAYYLSDVATNSIQQTIQPKSRMMYISPAPPGSPGPYIASVFRLPSAAAASRNIAVTFLKKDFSETRNVWVSSAYQPIDVEVPRADPLGETVAWSLARSPGSVLRFVAVKNVREPSSLPPTLIGGDFQSAHMCDWSENGNILANVTSDMKKWNLAVFDRKGRLLKMLDTPAAPAAGHIASWRKYLHR